MWARGCQQSGGCTEQSIQCPVRISWAKRPVHLCLTIARLPLPLLTLRQLVLHCIEPTPLVLHLLWGFLGEWGIIESGISKSSQVKTLRRIKLAHLT